MIDIHSLPPPNLSLMKLDVLTKQQLIAEVVKKRPGFKIIHEKYSIPFFTLKKYSKRIRKGLPLFYDGGRPPALDDISVSKLRQLYGNVESYQKSSLYPHIQHEYNETLRRCYPSGVSGHIRRKVSRSTMYRWAIRVTTPSLVTNEVN